MATLFFIHAHVWASSGFDEWHLRRRSRGEPFTVNNILYGNDRYVGISSLSIKTSTDGWNWEDHPTPVTYRPNNLLFGKGVFSLNGDFSNYLSTDGINWNAYPCPYLTPSAAAFGNGVFVNDKINLGSVISEDGMNWRAIKPTYSGRFSLMFFVNGNFIAMEGGGGTPTYTSTTGELWTKRTLPLTDVDYLQDVAYGNGLYVAVGIDGLFLRSSNLANWTLTQRLGGRLQSSIESVAYGNGRFVAVGTYSGYPTIFDSVDGITWRYITPDAERFYKVRYVNNRFMAVGLNTMLVSSDGQNWDSIYSPAGPALSGVVYGTNKFCAVGESAYLISTNGHSWESIIPPAAANAVAWDGSRFIIVGDRIITSTSGRSFSSRMSKLPGRLQGVAVGEAMRVAVGTNGLVCISTNGTAWTNTPSGLTASLNGVAFGSGKFVAVGYEGKIVWSRDGLAWTEAASPVNATLRGIGYCGGRFFAVGDGGALLRSTDGMAWSVGASGTTERLNSVAAIFENAIVICGANGTTLTSRDGIVWQKESVGLNDSLNAVCVGPTSMLMVGDRGQVVQSGSFGPRLARPRWGANQTLDADLYAEAGALCRIESSESLNGDIWTEENTFNAVEGMNPVSFPVVASGKKYYRAVFP